MKKYILPALLLMSLSNASEITKNNTKIVGGTVVPQSDNTWRAIVELKTPADHWCGGSLIAPKWVITAAHCVADGMGMNLTVGANSYNLDSTTNYSIAQVIMHENYNPTNTDNDIALIELNEAVIGVTPIAYDTASNDRPAGTSAKVAGWGNISTWGPDSYDLKELSVPLVNRDICNSEYANEVTDNMVCAGSMNQGVGTCFGDSGGPLIVNNTLVGIVSWGEPCAVENHADVYTNVKKYASWITENIGTQLGGDTFETDHPYTNNENITQEICVADGYTGPAKVTITGELERNYDFVTISAIDTRFTGQLDEEISVSSECVTVHFTTDGSIVKEGIVVTIEEAGSSNETDTFETAHPYANNEDVTQEICVADGYTGPAKVTITGELERNYDFVTISAIDTRFTGQLDEEISVSSECVTVHFTTDSSIVKEGIVVTIEEAGSSNETNTYETPHPYTYDLDTTQEICVPRKDYYEGALTYVRLTGELERNYDFITFSGVERRFTGVLNEDIILNGNRCVEVHFTSDGSISKEGVVAIIDIMGV